MHTPLLNSPQTLDPVKLDNLLNHLNSLPASLQHFILLFSTVSIHLGRPLPSHHFTGNWDLQSPPGISLTIWRLYLHLFFMHQKQCKSPRDDVCHKHTHTGANTQTSGLILSSNRHQVGRLHRELCQCVSVWVFSLLPSLPLSLSLPVSLYLSLSLTPPPLSETKWPDGFQSYMLIHNTQTVALTHLSPRQLLPFTPLCP